MIGELIRRWLYSMMVSTAQDITGFKPHYKSQYGQYLQGPRWFIIRNLRLWWDGWSCVDCGARYPLQVHHTSYRNKGKGAGFGEWWDCVTVCDDCHGRRHGRY